MSWISVGLGAAGIAGSFLGNKKKGGETVNLESLMPGWQKETGSQLASFIQRYMPNYVPGVAYSGKLSAGMTGQEKQGLSILSDYLNNPTTGKLFEASKGEIEKTLAGKYADPNASPFIQAMRNVSQQDLQDALNISRRGTGARGKFFSTAALGEEKDLANRNLQNLNSIIGSFIQNERQNILNAVPMANSMDQYELSTAPLAKVGASQSLGSLERILEQADLERRYSDFGRRQSELSNVIGQAGSLYGTNAQMGIPSWKMPQTQERNTFGQITDIINMLGGMGSSRGGAFAPLLAKLGLKGTSAI